MMSEPVFSSETKNPDVHATRRRWRRYVRITLLCLVPVALLTAVLWRPVKLAQEASHRSSCKCYLKQFGLALHNYHDTYGSFPPAFVLGPDGRPWHSWRVLILPFLECQPLYEEYRFDEPWDGPNNRKLLGKMPEVFACPSRPCDAKASLFPSLAFGLLACDAHPVSVRDGNTSYAAVLCQDCVFRGTEPVTIKEILDGTSNTALIGESNRTRIPWTKPEDIDIAFHSKLGDPDGFSSYHDQGCHFLFGDGTVQFVRTTVDQAIIDGLFTRNGREGFVCCDD